MIHNLYHHKKIKILKHVELCKKMNQFYLHYFSDNTCLCLYNYKFTKNIYFIVFTQLFFS